MPLKPSGLSFWQQHCWLNAELLAELQPTAAPCGEAKAVPCCSVLSCSALLSAPRLYHSSSICRTLLPSQSTGVKGSLLPAHGVTAAFPQQEWSFCVSPSTGCSPVERISSDCRRGGKWSLYNLQRRQQEGKLSPPQSCEPPLAHRLLVVSFTAPPVYWNDAYRGGGNAVLQCHGKCL